MNNSYAKPLRVRRIKIETDLEGIAELSVGCDDLHPVERIRQYVQQSHFDSKGFLVAEENGEIMGYIKGHLGYWIADGVFEADNAIGFIERILVHEKYRRKEIGTALMKSLLEYLKSPGARAVIVDTVTDEKRELAAKKLYKKFGFKEICNWTSKEYGELKRLIKILV